jgi:hypothetical protein
VTLVFDKASHTYSVGGVAIPNVTRVLEQVTNWTVVPEELLDAARARGDWVHKATCLLDEDDLDDSAVPEEYAPYLEAYRRFREEHEPLWDESEEPTYHPTLMYAGTPDRIGTLQHYYSIAHPEIARRVPCLLDIKTGGWHPAYDLQLAAYTEARRNQFRGKDLLPLGVIRATLLLRKDGTYRLREPLNTHAHDFTMFASLLRLWRWKRQYNV